MRSRIVIVSLILNIFQMGLFGQSFFVSIDEGNTLPETMVGIPSDEVSATIIGIGMMDDITVTIDDPFQITKISGDYSGNTKSLVFNNSGGLINSTFYIRMFGNNEGLHTDTIFLMSGGLEGFHGFVKGAIYTETANRFYVDANAIGLNDGSGWENAFTELRDALNKAIINDTVLVARGIYIPDSTSRDIPFLINNGVTLIGSLNGDEVIIDSTVLANRDFITNETILNGDVDNNDVAGNVVGNNSRNIFKAEECGPSTIIDGISFTGGDSYGGGCAIYNYNSSCIYKNIRVYNNETNDEDYGVIKNYEASPVFVNSLISKNYCLATATGAIIYNTYSSNPSFINTVLWGNNFSVSANFEYQVFNANSSSADFTNCIVEGSGGSGAGWDSDLGTDNGGNIDADPLFIDLDNWDIRLWDDSPALGGGDSINGNNIGILQNGGLPHPMLTIPSYSIDYDSKYVELEKFSIDTNYLFSAVDLMGDLVITSDENIEISLTPDGFDDHAKDTITITPVDGVVAEQTLHLRFHPLKYTDSKYHFVRFSSPYMTNKNSHFIFATIEKPTLWYVDDNAMGVDGGSSWSNAFRNPQTALNYAESGDTICVAKGVYNPYIDSRDDAFILTDGVKIYGGFAGNETGIDQGVLDNRDFVQNETILSGDVDGNDSLEIKSDNQYNVVRAVNDNSILRYGYGPETVLDGFTISGGYATTGTGMYSRGAGLYVGAGLTGYDVSFECKNLIFENNYATNGGAIAIDGIGNATCSIEPLFENIIFRNNSANSGGAVRISPLKNNNMIPEFKNVLFHDNSAELSGGCFYNSAGTEDNEGQMILSIKNATFHNNSDLSSIGVNIYNINQHVYSKITNKLYNVIMWDDHAVNAYINNNDAIGDTMNNEFFNSIIKGSGGSSGWSIGYNATDSLNNMDINPLYVSSSNNGFSLIQGSLAIGNGMPEIGSNIGYYQGSGYPSPEITTSASALNFNDTDIGMNSNELGLIISATNLYEELLIEAPENFEISFESGIFSGIRTLNIENEGSMATDTIYLLFTPQSVGTISDSLVITTSTVFTKKTGLSGMGIEAPVIFTGSNDYDLGFVRTDIDETHFEELYIHGLYLTNNLIINCPEPFYLKTETDSETKLSSINIEAVAGEIDTTIYIFFDPTSNSIFDDTITVSSIDAESKNILITGKGYMHPQISSVNNYTICQSVEMLSIPISVDDEDVDSLQFSFSSSNSTVLHLDSIEIHGFGGDRNLLLKPSQNAGISQITINVTDEDGYDSNTVFSLEVSDKYMTFIDTEICEDEIYTLNSKEYTQTGIYYDTLPSAIGCDSVIEISLTVNELPYAELGEDFMLMLGGQEFLDFGSSSDVTYSWSPDTSNHNSSYPVIANDLGLGQHIIMVTAITAANCVAKDSVNITVYDPNNGIENIIVKNARFYPNPVSDELLIELNDQIFEKIRIHMIDQIGRIVLENELSLIKGVNKLNVESLAPGVYNCLLIANETIIDSRKIIVK